jgi:serine/threonine-protein kinase
VIHRDLKPANIMVGEFGQVYIMDWGVARVLPWAMGSERGVQLAQDEERAELDTVGVVVGTPCYMAPEQVEGLHEETDERTDVFNLGATLYHVLTGQAPYQGGNYYTLMVAALHCDARPPEEIVEGDRIPSELLAITRRAMAARPEDRYPSVMDLKRDIERFLNGAWHLPTRDFAVGEEIVREGDEGSEAFIITRGRCAVLKAAEGGESELRRLGPGEVFGEMAIFSPGRRSATVRALEPVTVMVVDQDTLTRGLGLNSWMGRFVTALTDRFREVEERLRELEGREP